MKTQDLRIGNYYKWYSEGIEYIYQVEAKDFASDNIKNFYPIPLTEEWLLKLGFERKSCGEFQKSRFIYRFQQRDLIIEGFEYDYNGIICHPEYVHQLQNVIHSLTGEELTYENH